MGSSFFYKASIRTNIWESQNCLFLSKINTHLNKLSPTQNSQLQLVIQAGKFGFFPWAKTRRLHECVQRIRPYPVFCLQLFIPIDTNQRQSSSKLSCCFRTTEQVLSRQVFRKGNPCSSCLAIVVKGRRLHIDVIPKIPFSFREL